MNPKKVKPVGGNQPAGDEENDVYAVSITNCTTKEGRCQVLVLADLCLQRYNTARARFVATGDVGAFREALALEQDRAALLAEVGR